MWDGCDKCDKCDKWDKWDREGIVNFELGTSYKLAPAGECEPHRRLWEQWGVSHTGNYGSNGSNGMGESAGGKGNFEL